MFYCDDCRRKNAWPDQLFGCSYGKCEVCGEFAVCNDVPSSQLPPAEHPRTPSEQFASTMIDSTLNGHKYVDLARRCVAELALLKHAAIDGELSDEQRAVNEAKQEVLGRLLREAGVIGGGE